MTYQEPQTFIRLHDTQPGQEMDTCINKAFMAHAYSFILLRKDGIPCVFFGDLYGLEKPIREAPMTKLPDLVLARRLFAFGQQKDYFESSDCIGWVRHGTPDKPYGMAVVMSWAEEVPEVSDDEDDVPRIRMKIGSAGESFIDILGWEKSKVVIDESGVGSFPCGWNSMGVYVNQDAPEIKSCFPVEFDTNFHDLCL